MDFSRLRQGEIIAGLAGVALIITMFLDWYGVSGEGFDGWSSLNDFDGFLVSAAGVAGIALALLAGAGRRVNLGDLPRGCVTAALGAIAVGVIVWRLFSEPGASELDPEFGLFLGLAAAIGVTVGATMALREGGFDPLPPVPGGRTKPAPAAAASTTRRATASGGSRSSSGRSTSGRSGSRSSSSRSSSSRKSSSRSSGSRSRSSSSRSRSSGGRK